MSYNKFFAIIFYSKKNFLTQKKGAITPLLLVITTSLIVVIYGLLFLVSQQLDTSHRQIAFEQALHIAEAGVNYYRWHLAHAPDDFQDGTGQPGPYEHEYLDPQGKAIGKYSLDILPPVQGSSVISIKSTGWNYEYPNIKRKITVKYGKPSLTRFSFLQNASSWYGNGITVNGQIHSNNGIRMDGTNTSLVTSAKETYMCGSETGCYPPQSKPGIWGSGGDQGLWKFPVPNTDFEAISFDLANMLEAAQNQGLYLPYTNDDGYHLIFSSNGTVTVKTITNTGYLYGYSVPGQGLGQQGQGGCQRRYQLINQENTLGTYNLDNIPIIFAENHLWVEGTINGRTTVVAAKFPISSNKMNIWITNNLVYQAYDQSNALGLIAQNDIYFARNIPNDFRIDGALMAQTGSIIRHGYFWWCGGTSNAVKDSLTINGTIVSYYKSYWNFGSQPTSGFRTRVITYDNNLLYAPPPYFPTSSDYEFISWLEE